MLGAPILPETGATPPDPVAELGGARISVARALPLSTLGGARASSSTEKPGMADSSISSSSSACMYFGGLLVDISEMERDKSAGVNGSVSRGRLTWIHLNHIT